MTPLPWIGHTPLPNLPPFISNLFLFSPLLAIAAGFLYILDRLETARHYRETLAFTDNQQPTDAELTDAEDQLPTSPELQLPTDPQPPTESDAESDLVPLAPTFESEPETDPEDLGDDGASISEGSDDEDEFAPAPAADPAFPAAPLRIPTTRTIGTKKARSLARRDQRRAYHEFLHTQATQRAAEAAAELEEASSVAFENAQRRYILEEEIAARKASERAVRAAAEAREVELEAAATRMVVEALTGGRRVLLEELAERVGRGREWVDGVMRREGLVGVGASGEVMMVTRDRKSVV